MWRPRFATPAIVALDSAANRQFAAEIEASSAANNWSAAIANDLKTWTCQIVSATYSTINRGTQPGWQVTISVPSDASPELFSLTVSCSEVVCQQDMGVSVIPAFATNFYILHMADEQIVQEFHNAPSGQWYTTVGTAEEFNWEKDPIHLINPRFVMATGDDIDFNGCFDAYNNWGNWVTLYGTNYNYQPSGDRYFTQQETSAIEAKLTSLYFSYHKFRVPYVTCPGNHDVPPTTEYLKAANPPYVYWHSIGASFYETNWGQRSWSFRMGDFYVLMHDWSDSTLKTWANNDYTNALHDPSVTYRLIGQHYVTDQAIMPSAVNLMLVGHMHTTDTYQTSPYYVYVDGPAFSYGTNGFFNFKRGANGWTCDQTASARNTAKDVWPLFTDNGVLKKVRSDQPDAMNVTASSITITNDLPENFYDGRVRFVVNKGTYNSVTNGTILAQYDCDNSPKTAVLVKVNIPANGSIKVSLAANASPRNPEVEDPQTFGSSMKITFAGYNRAETLLSFPVLVCLGTNLPGFSYRQFASPAGNDLRFTDAGGTAALFHEIDEWNTNGVSYVWVQVPTLASSSDCIWAYWGNPALTNPPAWNTNGSTWSPGYDLDWHLKESAFPYADSAAQYPALSGVAPASTPSGLIGHGVLFNGASQYLSAGPVSLGNAFTLSAWINVNPASLQENTLFANKNGGWTDSGFSFFVNSWNKGDGVVEFDSVGIPVGSHNATAVTPAGAVSFGQWHLVTAVVDCTANTVRLYVDGVDRTSTSTVGAGIQTTNTLRVGSHLSNGCYVNGSLDEARIENGARSPNWVWAAYMNVLSNATFSSYAAVTQQVPSLSVASGAGGLVLSWPASGVGFAVGSATNLAPPVRWTPIPSSPSLLNSRWQLILPTDSFSTWFYRLQSQ